jgi:hypothetical protein
MNCITQNTKGAWDIEFWIIFVTEISYKLEKLGFEKKKSVQ